MLVVVLFLMASYVNKNRIVYIGQEAFAFYIGMERSQYSRIERGLNDVRLSSIARIAYGLGITPSELLDGVFTENGTLYEVKEIKKKDQTLS